MATTMPTTGPLETVSAAFTSAALVVALGLTVELVVLLSVRVMTIVDGPILRSSLVSVVDSPGKTVWEALAVVEVSICSVLLADWKIGVRLPLDAGSDVEMESSEVALLTGVDVWIVITPLSTTGMVVGTKTKSTESARSWDHSPM